MPMLSLADGRRLAYGEAGDGPPLVLVHGSPAEGRAWGRVAKHLPPGRRVLTPDLAGYGASDPLPEGTAGTAAMAAGVAALIAATADGPVQLAAHSYGGNVALHAALAAPDRIEALVLFEPVFFRGLALAGEDVALAAARAHFADYVRRVAGGENAAVSRMIDFWFGDGAYPRLPEPVRAYLEAAAPRNARDVEAALSEATDPAALAAFDVPTVIAYGTASPPVVATIARSLASLLPRATVVPMPDATHGMLDTHPAAVAALIADATGSR